VAWLGLMSVAAYFRRQRRSRRAQEVKLLRVRVIPLRHRRKGAGVVHPRGGRAACGPPRNLSRPTTARAALREVRAGERPPGFPRELRTRSVAAPIDGAPTPILGGVDRARRPIPARLRFSVLMRDGFRCRYCGRAASEPDVVLHIDHVIPRAAGGLTMENNLVASCAECNLGKSTRTVGSAWHR
jgi:hypothetical protein